MYEIGQRDTDTLRRAQTIEFGLPSEPSANHPQCRRASKPLALHVSHFHAAWFAN
jgi:hypothetical protein